MRKLFSLWILLQNFAQNAISILSLIISNIPVERNTLLIKVLIVHSSSFSFERERERSAQMVILLPKCQSIMIHHWLIWSVQCSTLIEFNQCSMFKVAFLSFSSLSVFLLLLHTFSIQLIFQWLSSDWITDTCIFFVPSARGSCNCFCSYHSSRLFSCPIVLFVFDCFIHRLRRKWWIATPFVLLTCLRVLLLDFFFNF